jgi:hypothetical protein
MGTQTSPPGLAGRASRFEVTIEVGGVTVPDRLSGPKSERPSNSLLGCTRLALGV